MLSQWLRSHCVGNRWMDEYGALVEWYWQGKLKYWEKNIIQRLRQMNEWLWNIGGMIPTGKTGVLGDKHYTAWVVEDWMNMGHWWNDTDRGKWSMWIKTLYSVCERRQWVWSIGRMILTGETEVLGEKHYTASAVEDWMSMGHSWNYNNRPKLKHWENSPSVPSATL
jgi:hypothetical protein